MEINLSVLLMIIGLGTTLVGALFGVKGVWGESSDTYYGRAFFYVFNLEYYISMINQKYRSLFGFSLIAIGTAMQISGNLVNSVFHINVSEILFYSMAFLLLIIFYLMVDIIIRFKVRKIVVKKMLRYYYDRYTNVEPSKDNKEERIENIYSVVYLGKKKGFKDIDESTVLEKACEMLKKYNI